MAKSDLTAITKNVVAISYKTGIPFSELAELPQAILEEYFSLLEAEIEASRR